MKSPKVSGDTSRRGFTLIQVVIVIALTAVLARMVTFGGAQFYKNQELVNTTESLVSYLRSAGARAIVSEGDLPHGVHITSTNMTLFRGTSYATRVTSYDTVRTHQSYVTVTGLTDLVFAKQTGIPSTSGTITLTNGSRTFILTVYASGAIEKN